MSDPETPIRIFIGSSAEGRDIALHLQHQLERQDVCEVDLWEHAFEPSGYALPSLLAAAERVDFAVLIATPDDTTESRGAVRESVRDNIILEFGLFTGVLGIQRTYLLPTGEVKLPSDVLGLTQLHYKQRSDGKVAPALIGAVLAIRQQIEDLGRRTMADALRSARVAETPTVPQAAPPPQAAQAFSPPAVSDAEMEEVDELVRKHRMGYSSAGSFYRDFENGKWLEGFKLPPAFEATVARRLLKEKWVREADLTRSWDHSNIVFMKLELVSDQLTVQDVDHLLELPTEDAHGHNQEAGLWPFLEYLEGANPSVLSKKALERLAALKKE